MVLGVSTSSFTVSGSSGRTRLVLGKISCLVVTLEWVVFTLSGGPLTQGPSQTESEDLRLKSKVSPTFGFAG